MNVSIFRVVSVLLFVLVMNECTWCILEIISRCFSSVAVVHPVIWALELSCQQLTLSLC